MRLTLTTVIAAVVWLPSAGRSEGLKLTADYLRAATANRDRKVQVVEPDFLTCLTDRPDAAVKVWVFFKDKAVSDRAGFESAALSVTLTERAKTRRAKVGLDGIVFADLPVPTEYIRAIENLGAEHRRSSRWLNAASFEMEASLVADIVALPFVAEIRPVMGFRRPPEPETEGREVPPPETQSVNTLDYGESYSQLQQIDVPAVHNKGYSGLGVTLALLDTGYRKTHEALARHVAEGRVLAEYDFVHNDFYTGPESTDYRADEASHGTRVWSVAAGWADGHLYGPAYKANFILCKTEDVSSETPVEEDNWVAAMEFADSIGTDVITTSLGYFHFDTACHCDYTVSDLDGQTATISIAASMADGLGIIVCNSAGNSGPGASTITPPADAFDILAVGSVSSSGTIATSSSRGPTYDGRIKPEVCARGVGTWCAHQSVDSGYGAYGSYSGTSFACPLVAGAACLVIEAHPEWTPQQVREALMASGNYAGDPNNTYGWGIIDVDAALSLRPTCCQGAVGNVDGLDGDEPTLADISALIDFLYINYTPPACLSEADINQSGGESPLRYDITIGDVATLIDHLFISQAPLRDCL
jgi:subtilisin family serine protease